MEWSGHARTCVPDLQPHDGVGIGVDDALGKEAGANSGGCFGWVEGTLAVTHDQRRLAHTLGAENNNLGLERRHPALRQLRQRGEVKGVSDKRGGGCGTTARLAAAREERGGLQSDARDDLREIW